MKPEHKKAMPEVEKAILEISPGMNLETGDGSDDPPRKFAALAGCSEGETQNAWSGRGTESFTRLVRCTQTSSETLVTLRLYAIGAHLCELEGH